jgi:hypothetical protein
MADHFTKPDKQVSVLRRNSKYRGNTSRGYRGGGGKCWQAHHILCNHAVEGRIIPGDANYKAYVEDCLWITDWDLNNSGNMYGMPTNRQYRLSNGKVPLNLPSHQVDHNTKGGYTYECRDWLTENVWNTLDEKRESHKVDATDLKQQLEDGSDWFRDLIFERGLRKKGTLYCWGRRFPTHSEHEKKWYFPFSMALKPSPRHAGVDWATLTNIFKKIG